MGTPSSMPVAKVADFGLARAATCADKMTVGAGTFRCMAPETMDSDAQYSGKVDVFSFAMLAYELVARKLPFEDDFPSSSDPRIAMAICNGTRPSLADVVDLPAAMLELVQSAWDGDPAKRPSFTEIEASMWAELDRLHPLSHSDD